MTIVMKAKVTLQLPAFYPRKLAMSVSQAPAAGSRRP